MIQGNIIECLRDMKKWSGGMTFKESIAEYLRKQSDEIAEDLCIAFSLPFDAVSQKSKCESN